MKNNKVIVDLFFKRGKYLLYLINERVKSGERREDVIKDIYVFCPSLEAVKIATNTIGLNPEHIIKYTDIFNNDLDGYIKWLKKMIEIDEFGFNRVISDNCELFCIQNPPYKGSLHLDFFEVGIDLIKKYNGKMVIIEPSTWLINVRKNGNAKKYDRIKTKISGHVESVIIENFNTKFNVENSEPFAITTIDMSKTFSTINYTCFGVNNTVDTIYDCNLIGKYEVIWNIFDKVQKYGKMLSSHITKKPINDDNIWYGRISRVSRCGCKSGNRYHLDSYYYGNVFKYYFYNGLDDRDDFSKTYFKSKGSNGKITDKDADFCVYGKYEELKNWKHFIFTNKLSLFLNLVLSINMDNNSKEFLPWLVDKQYTDDEINKLFGFTDEEIKLIDITIKKYERNSPWFKRYMCGKNGATDEEVTEYIKKITAEC
jgi:hypothetical protein